MFIVDHENKSVVLLDNPLYSASIDIRKLVSQLSDSSLFRFKLESGCLLYRLHPIIIISSQIDF